MAKPAFGEGFVLHFVLGLLKKMLLLDSSKKHGKILSLGCVSSLHSVEILDVGITVSPDMKACLFALENSFYLNFVLGHVYLTKLCLVFRYKQQIHEKKIYL